MTKEAVANLHVLPVDTNNRLVSDITKVPGIAYGAGLHLHVAKRCNDGKARSQLLGIVAHQSLSHAWMMDDTMLSIVCHDFQPVQKPPRIESRRI